MWWNDLLNLFSALEPTAQEIIKITDPDPNFNPLPNALWDAEDTIKLLIRFAINFGFIFVLIRFIYYPTAISKTSSLAVRPMGETWCSTMWGQRLNCS